MTPPDVTPMHVLVCGSRGWTNREVVFAVLDSIRRRFHVKTIISGGADGPDSFAIDWARERGVDYDVYRPVWRLGKDQGFRRNEFMVERLREYRERGDRGRVVAFWDGSSRGTKHTVDYAKKLRVPTETWG